MSDWVRVQTEDFDLSTEVARLRAGRADIGAVVTFVGTVRDINQGDTVATLELEHYPGMTEKALNEIRDEAHRRWHLENSLIIHRVGPLQPQDQIVLVATASRHRQDAFEAAQFIMDYLKTRAPFWKKEQTPDGHRWVDARDSDRAAAERWAE
ncbi:molybdopterin synthase catalytic subunit MoaE [Sulfurivirga sp.]|uniref:molybdopterin synthase catalytic subunit MoaE n=1 Tax=Sulfurivirga sp. TaxID=2614236 RepID=UPI0025CF3B6D|nr:molybdopterin synthase catalytic subunit MoaE [Sulfurivirga sp.]